VVPVRHPKAGSCMRVGFGYPKRESGFPFLNTLNPNPKHTRAAGDLIQSSWVQDCNRKQGLCQPR
jgi:hypothetical protein